jgi:uncharacterized iron-regulated membrane protein
MSFIHRPHQLWWRKAMFQIHLWVGIALCLYMLVIGVTGSILVLEEEIENVFYSRLVDAPEGAGPARVTAPEVVRIVEAAYPDKKLTLLYVPKHEDKNYLAFVNGRNKPLRVYISPRSGRIVGDVDPTKSWLSLVAGLHFRLLAGRTGSILNGIGGGCLLLLCASGIIIWWSGLQHWTRGLKVNLRKNWKRVNFDLHGAVGFWSFLPLSMWAFTAVYFVWPQPFEKFVGYFSSTASLDAPKFTVPPRSNRPWPSLESVLQEAHSAAPQGNFTGIFFPDDDKDALTVLMSRGEIRNFDKMDYLYFDPSTGKHLSTWHRGQADTWGAKLIFWFEPLHFGINFGLAIKILWATIGCALPVLSITGVLMYWNRSLSKKWRRLKALSRARRNRQSEVDSVHAG